MGRMEEFGLGVRLFLKAYPWRRIDPVPRTVLSKPLAECKAGLVTSAGFHTPEQPAFNQDLKGGDYSFREIPDDVPLDRLIESHRSQSFDHEGLQRDPNLVFPRDRLRELAARGIIGRVNHRHLSFMGSIVAPGRLIRETAPAAAALFKQDQVDLALLAPV